MDDPELIVYFDRISQQIEGVRKEMSQQVDGLRGEVDGLRGEMGGLRGEMSGLRQEVREENRHTRVLMEGLRSDVQLLAETVMDTRELFARHESNVERRLGEIQALFTLSYKDLNTRVSILEERAERQGGDAMEVIREKFGKRQT